MTFEKRVYLAGIAPNFLSAAFIYLYSMFIMQVEFSMMIKCLTVFLCMLIPAQFILAPLTNRLISRSLSIRIEKWKKDGLSPEERFQLFKDIQAFPKKKQYETLIFFFSATIILSIVYNFFTILRTHTTAMAQKRPSTHPLCVKGRWF